MKNSYVFKFVILWQNCNRMYWRYTLMYFPTVFFSWFVPSFSSVLCVFRFPITYLILAHSIWLLTSGFNSKLLSSICVIFYLFISSNNYIFSSDSVNKLCYSSWRHSILIVSFLIFILSTPQKFYIHDGICCLAY